MAILEPSRVASRILELARNPSIIAPIQDGEEGAVQPDLEYPVDAKGNPCLEPPIGHLQSSLNTIRGHTVWAVDGGASTIELPIGQLIVGRAVLIRMSFHGYETAQRELIVPGLPFVVYGAQSVDLPQALTAYLTEAIQLIPTELQTRPVSRPVIDYFTDGQAYLDKFASSWSGATQTEQQMAAAIDQVRNVAETIAFQVALRRARPRDIVLRDGRLHGSFGFWTSLWAKTNPPAQTDLAIRAWKEFEKDVKDAIRRDVRVAGIIKRPVASECIRWFQSNNIQIPIASSDSMLYMTITQQQVMPTGQFGKRSTLWRYKDSNHSEPQQETGPRTAYLEPFRRQTAFFYMMPGMGVAPFRVDLPTFYNMYRTWYDNIAHQIYTLARASGSPSRIPHPITIADAWARVPRHEAARLLFSLIAELGKHPDREAQRLAQSINTWIHRGR